MAKRPRSSNQKPPYSADFATTFCLPLRVPGVFPRPGSLHFIQEVPKGPAVERPAVAGPREPLIMAVAIAQHPEDRSAIRFRRGLDARALPGVKFLHSNRLQTVSRIMKQVALHKPAAVFIDATGIGCAIHARLAELGCPHLVGVDVHGRADRTDLDHEDRYFNKRAEMWGCLKAWCKVGCLPDDPDLLADLAAVEYGYDANDSIQLERKEDVKWRGLASPDDAEALALTFAYPVRHRSKAS